LPVSTTIRHHLRRHAPHLLPGSAAPERTGHQAPPVPARRVATTSDPTNCVPTAASPRTPVPTTPQPDVEIEPAHPRTIGLDGDGAAGAARAMIVEALAATGTGAPSVQVVIPGETYTRLLEDHAATTRRPDRLLVVPTLAAALHRLEEEVIHRNRLAYDRESSPPAPEADQEWPPLLLIAEPAAEALRGRMQATLQLGAHVGIRASMLGHWPGGDALMVDTDGGTQDGGRLSVLDAAGTAAMLGLLAEAEVVAESAAPSERSPGHEGASPAPTGSPNSPAVTDHPSLSDATAEAAVEPAEDARPVPDADRERHDRSAAASTAARKPDPTASRQPAAHDPAVSDRPASPADTRVSVRVLGPPAILDRSGHPISGLRAKSLELLVYLAVHRRGARLTDIMEALWPDATLRRASERLSTCAANLRGVIRSAAAAAPDTPEAADRKQVQPVINTGGHYHLNADVVNVDWWRVLDTSAVAAAAIEPLAKRKDLESAIAAVGGGLADNLGYEWIDTEREHVRRHLIKIYAAAAALLGDADPAAERSLYQTACQLDPLSDELARLAMRAAARAGDPDGIRRRLTILRRELSDAGIDLEPETEQLAAELLGYLLIPKPQRDSGN
jgi:two-component SAPR family response regulator